MLKEKDCFQPRGQEFYPNSSQLRFLLEFSPYGQQIVDYFHKNNVPVERLFNWSEAKKGLLSDIGILRHLLAGNIIINPFNIQRLQSNGYDVGLGEYYYAYSNPYGKDDSINLPVWLDGVGLYDPLDPVVVGLTWGKVRKAVLVREKLREAGEVLRGISREKREKFRFLEGYEADDRIIFLEPGKMVLGHTEEFIGGRNVISTTISGKSSVGRSLVEVCSDANLGDVGFISRWALELRNKSSDLAIILLVGQPIATIQFTELEQPASSYHGVYQAGQTLDEIVTSWKPEALLPKMRKKA